ncbi:MAG TPA: flagellar biosynthesis protein FlgJ [Tissierellia bacterium]|nr:flagellar biosynthesis protein FlgJ [Tissierellia bacterium]
MEIDNIGFYDKLSVFEKKAEAADKNKDDAQLMEVCREFESIFLNMLFKEMRNTIPDGGLIPKGTGTEIFEDMYYEEISKELSNREGLGIAKMLYEQFKSGYRVNR